MANFLATNGVVHLADYVGLSTDVKPTLATVDAGRVAYETDTGTFFVWDGATWVAVPALALSTVTQGPAGAAAWSTFVPGKVVSVTPTLTVHASYVSGDYVGTSGSAMSFAALARANGLSVEARSLVLVDKAGQSKAGELWLFDTAITPPADSAAWAVSDADLAHCVGVIPIAANQYYAEANGSVAVVPLTNLEMKADNADTALYGAFVTRDTPSYADGDLIFVLAIAQH